MKMLLLFFINLDISCSPSIRNVYAILYIGYHSKESSINMYMHRGFKLKNDELLPYHSLIYQRNQDGIQLSQNPFIPQKYFHPAHRFHGTQKDWLEPMVSTQTLDLKNID